MDDLIRRKAAIDEANAWLLDCLRVQKQNRSCGLIRRLEDLPPAQPDVKPIDYRDCANALLKLWMDNILTDGEYSKIIGKLNAHQLEMPYKEEGEQ